MTTSVALDDDVAAEFVAKYCNGVRRRLSSVLNLHLRHQLAAASVPAAPHMEAAPPPVQTTEQPTPSEPPNHLSTIMEGLYEYKNAKWPDGKRLFDDYAFQFICERAFDYEDLSSNQRRFVKKQFAVLKGYLERFPEPT